MATLPKWNPNPNNLEEEGPRIPWACGREVVVSEEVEYWQQVRAEEKEQKE